MKRLYLVLLFPLLVFALAWWIIKYVWCIIVNPSEAFRLALSVDQTANAAFNGNEDESISSRAGRHSQQDDDRECWAVWLCWLLDKVDNNHCNKSIGV